MDPAAREKFPGHVTVIRPASSSLRASLNGAQTKEMTMSDNTRLIWHAVAPQGAKALFGIHHYITTGTNLPGELIHLVFLRVSQINGCAHCIDLHTRDLLKTMSIDKVALVPVWAEVPHLFPEQYRAALAWAEEVTLVSETHASDACGGCSCIRAEGSCRSHHHHCCDECLQSPRRAIPPARKGAGLTNLTKGSFQ
jgi:AhpD family alkylhydroperoxidase